MTDVNRYLVYFYVKRPVGPEPPAGTPDNRESIVRFLLDTTDFDRAKSYQNWLTPMYGDNIRVLSYTVASGKDYRDYLKTHKGALK